VGVDRVLESGDQLLLTQRNVAFHLAREKSLGGVAAEYEGRHEGLGGGRLGSMNLVNASLGIVYTSSILANNLPVACGLAWARRLRRSEAAVFAATGDGAMEEGAFYETLVFARSRGLPLVILIENNDHSLASTIRERRSEIRVSELCASVGVASVTLSGNRADLYEEELRRARNIAIGGTPVCVEVLVTTLCNHAGPTPGWAADPKSIDLNSGLIVEESGRDPVWVSRQLMGEAEYERCVAGLGGSRGGAASTEVRCLVT
jgi:pyruvate dehydrogenase E1 component alpha subunit